ncbi:TPA: 2-oxoacid ferredoxin oxidoreductase [Candidatus Geothermarchaeota archaeon]|nr:2-oxoacid ferredoxin oxidoreductase [Candidatus Geothermarchaeota archaeon]HIQ12898.1 2-oxoacid ferredoxin oxidoreductase [Thermoprotei archaeon]
MSSGLTIREYDYKKPTWCPGCGDYTILNVLKKVFSSMNIPPHRIVIVSGIGCGSKLPHYIRVNGFHTIHGRPLPVAMGLKIARPDLTIVSIGGDGDTFGIGAGHMVNVPRSNIGIVHLAQNNGVFGLTTGQPSPTAPKGFRGTIYEPFKPLQVALASGATFVARTWTGNPSHMEFVIKEALKHVMAGYGFAFVDIIQYCITYNPLIFGEPFITYYRKREYDLQKDPDYDPTDIINAYKMAYMDGDKVPMGIFYRDTSKKALEVEFGLIDQPPGLMDIDGIDVKEILDKYM